MKPGENFEIDAVSHLNSHYTYCGKIKFVRGDTSDSTKSDIEVIISGRSTFFIEAKDTAAQSGQFVLLPNEQDKKFIFSPRNQSEPNEMTDIIIDYMNHDFERYNEAGTRGEKIEIDNAIFYNWIISHYTKKGAKFFITKKNSFIIAPTYRFPYYFDVSATYRIKKSGSGEPSKKDVDKIEQIIKNVYANAEFNIDGKKLYTKITNPLSIRDFRLGDYTYRLSEKNSNRYEIRKLSNTYHMNVIFSINVKQEQAIEDLFLFKKELDLLR